MNSLIKKQLNAERDMLKTFNEGHYTLESPLIVVDPYGINPLSAYILFKTQFPTAVTVTIKGKNEISDIKQVFGRNTTHVLPVFGLYMNATTKVEISLYQQEPVVLEIQTKNVELIENLVIDFDADPLVMANKLLVYASPVTWFKHNYPVGIDINGDIRWISIHPFNFDIKQLDNGNFIAANGEMLVEPYYVSGLVEFDWMCKIKTFYQIDTMVHHDYIELNDTDLLVLTDQKDSGTTEDSFIVFDRVTGEIKKRWNYQEFLNPKDVRQSGSGSRSDFDWFHNNAVWYDAHNNTVTLSGRHIDALINLDFDSQKINWILSNPKGWNPELVEKYFLKPTGYNFEYTYGQHAVSVTNKGEIICFDNHYLGKKSPDYIPPEHSYSRGVRFKVNPTLRTVETVWQFGKDLGTRVYSPYISFVESFDDNHNLIHFGGTSFEDGKVSKFHGPSAHELGLDMESQTFEVAYGKQVLHSHVKGNYYRARKFPVQIKNYEFTYNEPVIITVK